MHLASLSIRIDPSNPDHHIWDNHGTWWCHYTLHRDGRKRRVRVSLETRTREEARKRRDTFFAALESLGVTTNPPTRREGELAA